MKPLFLAVPMVLGIALSERAAAQDPVPPVVIKAEVKAPQAEVWRALTTQDGVTSFFAPSARVEPRIGGPYEMYFLLDNAAGRRGGEGNTVLALEPSHRLLVSWNAPANFGPLRDQHTIVEYQLSVLPDGSTLVTTTHSGWGRGPEWKAVRDYFSSAWRVVLGRLQYRFDKGPVDWRQPYMGAEYFRPSP